MIFKNIILSLITINNYLFSTHCYVTNANRVIFNEQKVFNELLDMHNIRCHLQTARIKSFESSLQKMKKTKTDNVYDLYDLIGFRFVFYTKEDLLKFYYLIKLEKSILYYKNYITSPKENGYSAMHIRYCNEYKYCPIKLLECQLYIISDYYNGLYGNARRTDKNYTLYF